jgi:hypothetical protein
MPRTFTIPDELAQALDEWAPAMGKPDANALLLWLIEIFKKAKEGQKSGRATSAQEKS